MIPSLTPLLLCLSPHHRKTRTFDCYLSGCGVYLTKSQARVHLVVKPGPQILPAGCNPFSQMVDYMSSFLSLLGQQRQGLQQSTRYLLFLPCACLCRCHSFVFTTAVPERETAFKNALPLSRPRHRRNIRAVRLLYQCVPVHHFPVVGGNYYSCLELIIFYPRCFMCDHNRTPGKQASLHVQHHRDHHGEPSRTRLRGH